MLLGQGIFGNIKLFFGETPFDKGFQRVPGGFQEWLQVFIFCGGVDAGTAVIPLSAGVGVDIINPASLDPQLFHEQGCEVIGQNCVHEIVDLFMVEFIFVEVASDPHLGLVGVWDGDQVNFRIGLGKGFLMPGFSDKVGFGDSSRIR